MKKLILSFFFVFAFGVSLFAQFRTSNLTFGGGIGLQFGDYTMINVAPQVGYNFTKYLNVGAGINYSYFNEKYDRKTRQETASYLGINLYTKVYPLPYIVVMVQPEANRMWRTYKNRQTGTKIETDKMVPVCLVGAGVRLGPVTAMLQYDVVQDDYTPYGSRIFYSVGYTFSF